VAFVLANDRRRGENENRYQNLDDDARVSQTVRRDEYKIPFRTSEDVENGRRFFYRPNGTNIYVLFGAAILVNIGNFLLKIHMDIEITIG